MYGLAPDAGDDDLAAVTGELARDTSSRLGELAFAAVQRFGAVAAAAGVGLWEARTGQSLLFPSGTRPVAEPRPAQAPAIAAAPAVAAVPAPQGRTAKKPDRFEDMLKAFLG